MATTKLLANVVTAVDCIKQLGPDGNIMEVAETLTEFNEILQDAAMTMANDVFQHTTLIPKSLGQFKPRTINSGAQKSAPKMAQITEQIMLLDIISEVDEELVINMPDKDKARWNRTKLMLEGAMQELSRIIWYGNKGVDAAEIDGYFTRFNSTSLANVHTLSGSGSDTTSLALIEWGEMVNTLIYPRGAKNAGIEDNPKPLEKAYDASMNPFYAYSHQIKAKLGISIPDTRALQRLVNIESTGVSNNLNASGGMYPLVRAINKLPHAGKNAIIYVNRDLKSQFDIWALDKANGCYMIDNLSGEPVTVFRKIPVKMSEQILSTETAI